MSRPPHITTLLKLRDRLSDLSMRNRSLRLVRLPKKRAFDFAWLDGVHAGDSGRALEKLLGGKAAPSLLTGVGAFDDRAQELHRGLTYLDREVRLVEDERGVYDLSVGLMFLCGAVAEGKYIQAPLFLVPRRLMLERRATGVAAWFLEPIGDPKEVNVNRTLLLALQKYKDVLLDPEELEEAAAEILFGGRRSTNWIADLAVRSAAMLSAGGLSAHGMSHLTESGTSRSPEVASGDLVPALSTYTAATLPTGKSARFEVRPNAVLSRYPLADTSLLSDYDDLLRILDIAPNQPLSYAGALLGLPSKTPQPSGSPRAPFASPRWHIGSTDESQEAVIAEVVGGQSMAVYGPPGTGKSQFIANLVATALATNKRVLVVSQKRPALDVVAQRLGADIDRFVAVVHDPVRDREALVKKITRGLSPDLVYSRAADGRARARELKIIAEQEAWFDSVHAALTEPEEREGNAYGALLARIEHAGSYGSIKPGSLPAKSLLDLEDLIPRIPSYLRDLREARAPGSWRATRPDYSKWTADDLDSFVEGDLAQAVQAIDDAEEWTKTRGNESYDLESATRVSGDAVKLVRWSQTASAVDASIWSWVPEVLALERPDEVIGEDIKALGLLLRARDDAGGAALVPTTSAASAAAVFDAYDQLRGRACRIVMPEWYRVRERLRIVLADQGLDGLPAEPAIAQWRLRAAYSVVLDETPRNLRVVTAARLSDVHFSKQDLKRLHDEFLAALRLVTAWRSLPESVRRVASAMPRSSAEAVDLVRLGTHLTSAPSLASAVERSRDSVFEWVGPEARLWVDDAMRAGRGSDLANRFKSEVSSAFEALRLADRRTLDFERRAGALAGVARRYQEAGGQDVEHDLWNAYAQRWMRDSEKRHPVLADVTQSHVEERRRLLREAWGRLPTVNRGALMATLHDATVGIDHRDRAELLKRAEQQRRRWPIRKLVEGLWKRGLSELLPVWLCSPETVAAVFPLTPNLFDYVVFDEASQCTLAQGLTATYRGRTSVIVGDEQQLPPSSLFSTTLEEDEDELDDVFDEESLLGRAKSAGADMSLAWHYRSQYPELIQFSNDRFYHGGLRVSPLPVTRFEPPALEWVDAGGVWDRRVNECEGRLAVDLLSVYLRDHPDKSLGIITLNRTQADFVQDLIVRRLEEDREFSERFAAAMKREMDARPFVRNLENVQGDERDIVILSIAYSADASGRVPLRFGALSAPGGARRLNVAVSRARQKMLVLCSFDPETQLAVGDTNAEGAQVLRDYLIYCRQMAVRAGAGGHASSSSLASTHHDHGAMLEVLAEGLRRRGWDGDALVGASAARVDLAIRSRRDPERYVLGVLLDGPGANWAKTAVGREVGRAEYLARYQWHVHHVVSRSLATEMQDVLEEIVRRLEAEDVDLVAVRPPPQVMWDDLVVKRPFVVTDARTTASALSGGGQSSPVKGDGFASVKSTAEARQRLDPSSKSFPSPAPLPLDSTPKAVVVVAGSAVVFRSLFTGEERRVQLAGPSVVPGPEVLALDKPLAQALMGAEEGQVVALELSDRTVEFEVLRIEIS